MNKLNGIDAVRIKVALEENPSDIRRFVIDPNITTFVDLYKWIQRAFYLKRRLEISYRLSCGNSLLPFTISSDKDLQDAVLAAVNSPYLELSVHVADGPDVANYNSEDWIILDGYDIPMIKDIRSFGGRLALPIASALRKRVENTLYQITSAFVDMSRKTPLGESDWSTHFDDEGRLIRPQELWVIVFNWGVEPSLRKHVWKHLLNVFPPDLTETEREKYLAMKCKVYWQVLASWQREDQLPKTESLRDMVWKDVRRTDRTYPYFEVPDEHHRLTSLFNILVTYAILNPDVSYAQGMSDLAAPILVVMDDEAITFTCFSTLMTRSKKHFLPDGKAMSLKFDHLTLLVQKFDPELYKFLLQVEADDLFFCYRWLVLDLKREFNFDDALQVMEVIWSSLLPPPPKDAPKSPSGATFNTANKLCNNSSAVLRSEGYNSLPYSYQALVHANDDNFDDEEEYSQLNLNDFGGKLELVSLPDPYHLGDGNPFTLFICLAILILHRERVFSEQDYNSLASSFDKKVRKHDAEKVLSKARELFSRYLRHCELVDNNEFVSLQKPKEKAGQKKNESWFDDSSCEIVSNAGQEIQC